MPTAGLLRDTLGGILDIVSPKTVPETSGGGYNLFCGEVYRLPLDLHQRPGGLDAIVGDGCAL